MPNSTTEPRRDPDPMTTRSRTMLCTAALILLSLSPAVAQTNLKYQLPPKSIVDLVDTKPTPEVQLSPPATQGKRWMLIESASGLPSTADLAQPELRLAGLRFNPRTDGPSRGRYITSLS